MNIYTTFLDHFGQQVPESRSLANVIDLVTSDECKELVQSIRAANELKGKKLKIKLPLFFPTVQFFEKNTLSDDSIPTGIVQFDIDTKDNDGLNFGKLKSIVKSIPETIFVFESPRGGLKFGILTDFKKNSGEDLNSLKKRFNQAYRLTLEYVQRFVTVDDDEHMKDLKFACFLSWDQDAYYNPECSTLSVNDQCIYNPPEMIATSEPDVTTEQIEELLQFIPNDFNWGERRSINYAVFSCIGQLGIPILFNHWTTSNRDKLQRDLEEQCLSMEFGSLGHLVNVAKEYGYKPVVGKARNKLLPKESDYQFEPLVSYDEGMEQLNQFLQKFFETGRNTFINVSTGAGKTDAVIQFLRNLPRRNELKRYNRKRVLVLVPSHDLAIQYKQRLSGKVNNGKAVRVNHILGKQTVCERKESYLDLFYDAGVNPPIQVCTQVCDMFETCPYIKQFDDMLTNIRIMTHEELVNMPSAWLYGSRNGMPRKGGWKPDYIIVDEDWLTKTEYEESYSDTDYESIRNIIHECRNGAPLADAVNHHRVQVLIDNEEMVASKAPKFVNAKQFINDSQKTHGKKYSAILKLFTDYVLTGDEVYLRSIRLEKNKLRASLIKSIADRYQGIPTLFLDATADKGVVTQLVDVDFRSISINPKDDINLYQLQGRTVLKKDFVNEEFRNQVILGLRAMVQRYTNVGLISYKSIEGFQGNFSEWLAGQCGIHTFGHFGNIRGMDQFKDVDCLLVVGRHLIPDHELENYCYGVFGHANKDKEYVDVPVRMKGGKTMALNNRPFVESNMRRVKKHFSDSETIQAIGRARLIHGSSKDIYFFSHESLGADVQVTDFFELSDFIDSPEVTELKRIGFCQDKPKYLHELGYPKSRIKEKRKQIDTELLNSGVKKVDLLIKDRNRNTRTHTYYVHDMGKLEKYVIESDGVIQAHSFE